MVGLSHAVAVALVSLQDVLRLQDRSSVNSRASTIRHDEKVINKYERVFFFTSTLLFEYLIDKHEVTIAYDEPTHQYAPAFCPLALSVLQNFNPTKDYVPRLSKY